MLKGWMGSRGALAAVIVALVTAAQLPAAAHTKSYKTTITIIEAEVGTPGEVAGELASRNLDCVIDRAVNVYRGSTLIGTTKADEEGSWIIDANVSGGDRLTAKAVKDVLKRSRRHRHVCDADTSKVVVAPFALTVSVTGDGNVESDPPGITCDKSSSPCTNTFRSSPPTLLEATPDAGAAFLGWSGACTGTATRCSVRVDGNKSVSAAFSTVPAPVTRVLELSVTGPGTVTGSGINCGSGGGDCVEDYPINTQVTITATPDTQFDSFDGWGDACSGTATTCTLTMSTDRFVTATFSSATSGLPGPLAELIATLLGLLGLG